MMSITTFGFGQDLELIKTETEEFYKLLQDSIDPELKYPDGRYKVFLSDTNNLPSHVFYLKKGNVEGPYLKLTPGGWIHGNYSQDSLWTFLTAPEDTTFKIGTWRHHIYGLGYSRNYNYKMPYDSSGNFTEVWRFHNGQIAREASYQKSFGLKIETYWDFETREVFLQTINKGNKNYYQSIVYKNDSISYVSLKQNGIEIVIDLECWPYFYENEPCTKVSVFTDNWDKVDIPMASISIDNSKVISNFNDTKRQIFFSEDKDGNIQVRYLNKKGKLKYRKLKIR